MLKLTRKWGALSFLLGFVFCALVPSRAAETHVYVVRYDHWTEEDEQSYRAFIQAIGESDCGTLDACLHSSANPFRDSDIEHHFASDCADLPYVLRFYYAWKRGLPFSYVSTVEPRDGKGGDIRYSRNGNIVASRTDAPRETLTGYQIIDRIRDAVSSATYRIHPDTDGPLPPDLYSPAITPKSIQPGTIVYDPAGHVAIVFRIDPDGRIHTFDAHTDYSLTQMVFDVRFARMRPAQGAGFKNWRPVRLVDATREADGTLRGGHIEVARNAEIADFSTEQFYGTGKRPPEEQWASGSFVVNGENLSYYDFVRARLAGGKLVFNPVQEVREMTWSLCSDLHYRAEAVELARAEARKPEPDRLPRNIYGTSGDWEMFSTPSRDARLKTAFKYLRDTVQRFVEMEKRGDTQHLAYDGDDLRDDLLKAYSRAASYCRITYGRSDSSLQSLSLEDARVRLFAMSFDPYHCPERRWGASDAAELSTCPDGALKQAWYEAEQPLRNQIERAYDARMDFTLDELRAASSGNGSPAAPDTDVTGYLQRTVVRN